MKAYYALACLVLLAACAPEEIQRGYLFNKDQLAKITVGESTQADVLQLLGSPSSRSDFEVERWHYVGQLAHKRSVLNPSVEEHEAVTIEFDGEGKVGKIQTKNLADVKDVDTVQRETPSEGNRFNTLEQLIGNFGRFNKSKQDAAKN